MNDKEFYDSLRIKYNNVLNAPDDEIKNVYQSTLKAEPKQVANIMNVANKINAHPIAVQNDLKGATEAANMPADEYWEHLRKNRPITYNYLSEPLNMATVKDIIQEQDNREGFFQQMTHGYRSGDLNVMQGQLGSQQVLAVLSGGDPNINENSLKDIESEMDELNQTAPKGWTIAPAYFVANQIPNLLFGAQKAIERGAPGAVAATGIALLAGQAGPQALIPEEVITLPTAFGIGLAAGGKVGYAEATAILETGSAYRDFIKLKDRNGKPVDKKTAAYYALAVGAINSGLEMATLNTFLKAIGAQKVVELLGTKRIKELVKKKTAGKAIKKAFGDYLKAIGTETATEVLQEVSNVAAKSVIEGELEAGKGLEQIAGVISPTIQATAANPLTLLGLGTNTIENIHQVNRAKANAEFYGQVGQNANNSELLKRYPDGFKTIVAQQTAGTPIENVYIDAEQFVTLMQEQNPDILNASELVAKQLGFDDQLQNALETGDKIKVSLADWTANVAPTEFYEKIKPHVSFSADGLTLFQAEQEEKRIGEEIKAEQQKASELMAQDEEKQTAYNTIYEDVKSKLLEAGRPENIKEKSWNSYVDKSAKLWASHAFAEASRRQMSITEWYQGANVPQITKEQLQESVLNQQAINKIHQSIGSAGTSLNQVAAVFKKDYLKSGSVNLDLGGGKYDTGTEFLKEKGVTNLVYDPFNRTEKYNNNIINYLKNNRVDTVTNNNVLNVIKEPEVRMDVIRQTAKALKENGTAYFQIYEGDKSGQGRISKIKKGIAESWQNNLPTQNYIDEVKNYYKNVTRKGNIIIAKKPIKTSGMGIWEYGNELYFQSEQISPEKGSFLLQDQTIPRGFVKITPEGSLVGLLGSSDASTFLHESAHIFLNDTFEFVKTGQADEEYLKDWSTLKEWLNVADDQETLTTEQQEQFARGFEAYLYEGKSPSEGLKKAFAAFRRWLTRIYRDVKKLDVELSDPVRQVMDRMLATDEEIAEAEALSGYNEDIITEADVTPETWAKLQDIKTKAHEEAVNRLLKKQMDELKEENKQFLENEREAFRGLVEEEISKEPVYQTMEEVRSNFGGKNIKDTANKYINKELTSKGQYKFDTIAETNGYSSGSELAQIIIDTPFFNDVVDQRLNEHMEQYSDLMNTARIKEAALEAIRNDKQLEFEALERELIMEFVQKAEAGQARRQSALERSRIAVSAAKNHAKEILSRKNYRESTAFKSYFKVERDAAVKAALALKSGNDVAAARFAEQRMLNHALAMEAIKNQKDVQKYLNYFKKFQRRHGNLLKMPAEFMTQIEGIMERFGLIEPVQRTEKPELLLEFVERMTNEYHDIPISDDILSGTSKPLNELTLGELKDVYNAIKTIATLGNKWTRFYSDFLKAELNAVGKEIADSIVKNVGEKKADTERFTTPKRGIQKASKLAEEINNWLVKPEFLAKFLDGNQDGPMQKYFIELFNRAWTDEKILEQKTVTEFKELIKRYFAENELSKMSKEMIFLPEVGQSMSKEQIITAVLNMGNEQNKQRLMDGHNLTDEMAQSIVDVLNEKELQMIQDIWNYLETFWPAIAKLEEEVTGVVPEKVEAVPLETKFGTLSGGYYPIKYDAEKSIRMSKYEEQTNALYKETPAAKAATRHGHTKKRAKTVNHKLNLNFGVIPNHLVNVVHDLTHRKAIIDANRLLRQEDVQRAITNAVGIKGYKLLENSVKAIASDQGEYLDVADKAFRWMRSRTTLGAMGLNLRVALLQTSGFFQSAWEIGAIPTTKGIAEFASNPIESWKFVKEKSVFMANRGQLIDRDIYDFSRRTFKGDNKIQRYAYSLIGIMDQSVSVPTWLGAYKKELEQSGNEEAAIRAGDGAVRRSQGTGSIKDLSAAQRGTELKKLFTMFYSYGNLLYNRFWLATSTAGVQLSKGQHEEAIKNIAAMTFYGWILPGTFEFVLREAVRSHKDDDPEKFMKRLISSMASGLLQTIPIVRDVGSYLLNKALGVYSSFRATPIESSIESIGDVVTKGRKLIEGTGEWIDFGEAASKTGAFVSGIPQQTVTWVFNFLDWMENNGEADWKDLFSRRRD
jgi:hypothetical protein